MQIRLLIFFCFFLSLNALGNTQIDSIGVENNNGKKIILHKITPKETYFSLSRRYGIPAKDIISYNSNVSLQIGTIVKIPTEQPYSASVRSEKTAAPAPDNAITYKVGRGETLYAIAKRFNTNVEDIKQLNNLQGNSLSVGQLIKVRSAAAAAEAEKEAARAAASRIPAISVTNEEDDADSSAGSAIAHINRYGLREISERGVAVWIADENLDGSKMLVLHRNAPVGTVVKITNPMTERSTFAKVVGRFTENETTKDVIIVVTKATADLLGALDKRFQVGIVYGVPNE